MMTPSRRGSEEMLAVGSPSNLYHNHHHHHSYHRAGVTGFGSMPVRRRLRSVSQCSDEMNSNSVNDLPYIYESEGYDSSSHSPVYSPDHLQQQQQQSLRQFSASIPIPVESSMRHSHYQHQQPHQQAPKQPSVGSSQRACEPGIC